MCSRESKRCFPNCSCLIVLSTPVRFVNLGCFKATVFVCLQQVLIFSSWICFLSLSLTFIAFYVVRVSVSFRQKKRQDGVAMAALCARSICCPEDKVMCVGAIKNCVWFFFYLTDECATSLHWKRLI